MEPDGKVYTLTAMNHFLLTFLFRNNCMIWLISQKTYFSGILLQSSCPQSIIHQTFTKPLPWARHTADSNTVPAVEDLMGQWEMLLNWQNDFPLFSFTLSRLQATGSNNIAWPYTIFLYFLAFVLAFPLISYYLNLISMKPKPIALSPGKPFLFGNPLWFL
jgi:hypothetical protein